MASPATAPARLSLLLTRPRDDAGPLAAALRRRGHRVLVEPMMEIRRLPAAPLDLNGVQALLLTSANGARALAERSVPRNLPVLAVGDASARAAVEAGFGRVESAGGDVDDLAALVRRRLDPAAGRLLHVAGSSVAGDLAGALRAIGYAVDRVALYHAVPAAALSADCLTALDRGGLDGILFFSPRSARAFATLAGAAGRTEACRRLYGFFLSRAVAAASGLGWHRMHVAAAPTQQAMLALIDEASRTA